MMRNTATLAMTAALLTGCSVTDTTNDSAANTVQPAALAAPVADAAAVPAAPAAAVAVAVAGFDPDKAPVATPKLGAWPYFSLIDGYVAMTRENAPGDSAKDLLRDVAFDEYQLFDGTRLLRVEGRLKTARATGKGASFFEVRKTYERLVRQAGGVTVFEGSGAVMEKARLVFADRRHRGTILASDAMGVYMIRTADRQIWVEVYQPWNTSADNYWLTIIETRPLEARASVLPAAEMKRALDATGRIALYVNFDPDKTAIRPESAPLVAQIVELLTTNPGLRVAVDGHTDNSGDPKRNQALALGRANAVMGTLVAQGIDPARLKARGFGADKPLAPNDSDANKAKNRRVELVKL